MLPTKQKINLKKEKIPKNIEKNPITMAEE